MVPPRVRVFIGSGEASRLERKTLIYSLRKNSQRNLELYVFNGTHNAVEPIDGGEPFVAPLSLKVKYSNITEFSSYRFLIPQLCNYQGKAIYLDSDMVALGDIGELFDSPIGDAEYLAKAEAYKYGNSSEPRWGLSVLLINCETCRFDLDTIFDEINRGLYTFTDFHQMTPRFLSLHPYKIGSIDPNWNVFDRYDEQTKLIHYTHLDTQPWRIPRHPYGDVWFRYFNEAREAGAITEDDIRLTMLRGYVRSDILDGNDPPLRPFRHAKRLIKRLPFVKRILALRR